MSTTLTHSGLPGGMEPFNLVNILGKLRVSLGIRDEDVAYLRGALQMVREEDFQSGRICAFWEGVATIADRLGFNVRQVHRIETRLERCGLIRRTGLRNGRRFGARRSGRIIYAGGINLAPLIECTGELQGLLRARQITREQLQEERDRARELIEQIRSLDAPQALEASRAAFPRLRPSEIGSTEKLAEVIAALEAVLAEFSASSGRTVGTAPSDSSGRPSTKTDMKINIGTAESPAKAEPLRATPDDALRLVSDDLGDMIRFYAESLPSDGRSPWRAVVLACRERARMLGLTPGQWDTACDLQGEVRASLCLIIVDRNATRSGRYAVRDPAAAFIGMVRKEAREGAVLETLAEELRRFAGREHRG